MLELGQAGAILEPEAVDRKIRARLQSEVRRELRHANKRVYLDQMDWLPARNGDAAPDGPHELNALARAIARLPKQQRRVVRFRYEGGMPWQAIAEIVGTSVRSGKKLHEEALKRLDATLRRARTHHQVLVPGRRLHLCPSSRKRRAA